MAQFTIIPGTYTNPVVSFTPSVDIQINSIENIHALELGFNINDTISANTKVYIQEGYASKSFIPEVVVNYTEI